MDVLCAQRTSLEQDNSTRTRLISAPPPVPRQLEECSQEFEGKLSSPNPSLTFGNLNELLGHLAGQGYAAEKVAESLCAEDAPSVMDMIQVHLDEETSHNDRYLRKSCIQCLLHLNKRHGTLPTSIHLSKVAKDGLHPVSGGGFADIWKGRLEDTRTVCLKVLRVYTATYDEKRLLKQLSKEVLLWRQLRHPNILQFLGITKELFRPSYCIVSPWMANGDVISYSRARKSTLDDKVKMMREISEGIQYLHEHHPPIVHSDIKGLNILVSDHGSCCLADFGLATIENESSDGHVHLNTSEAVVRGSLPWLAPELMNPQHISIPSRTARDIYAFGCTIFELLTGKGPFSEKKMDVQIIMAVLNGSRPARPFNCPDWLWAIVESCWKENFQVRPTATEVACRLTESTTQREPKSDSAISRHTIHIDDALTVLPPSWTVSLAKAGFTEEEIAAIYKRPRVQQTEISASPPPPNPSSVKRTSYSHSTSTPFNDTDPSVRYGYSIASTPSPPSIHHPHLPDEATDRKHKGSGTPEAEVGALEDISKGKTTSLRTTSVNDSSNSGSDNITTDAFDRYNNASEFPTSPLDQPELFTQLSPREANQTGNSLHHADLKTGSSSLASRQKRSGSPSVEHEHEVRVKRGRGGFWRKPARSTIGPIPMPISVPTQTSGVSNSITKTPSPSIRASTLLLSSAPPTGLFIPCVSSPSCSTSTAPRDAATSEGFSHRMMTMCAGMKWPTADEERALDKDFQAARETNVPLHVPYVHDTHRMWDDVSLRDAWQRFRARVGIH
ncbi:hypothetical protein E1B28_012697 [Marasmius oreades]|uniref:Protein kinase domain-containing protein n=1 Tax=Marasmius oreades TaxID=181124 RepID=A0A9P7UR25_9AGAR|nr:uncharacterized protein E1B28_012697 [Marasmius oreades]KAG7088729.1 hypothetical protein E1B28_012697 [Marasmius oreades]